jgi:hypothetical protein
MSNPRSGYYRNILSNSFPNVRIAFTHTPIIGCTRIPKEPIIAALKDSNDEYASYYINGLENGSMVTITENQYEKTWANNGELYFKS